MDISELKRLTAYLRGELNTEFSVVQLEIFLTIAQKEKARLENIEEQIPIPKLLVKNSIKKLTNQAKGAIYMQIGYSLCDIDDDGQIFLTQKGKQIVENISSGKYEAKKNQAAGAGDANPFFGVTGER